MPLPFLVPIATSLGSAAIGGIFSAISAHKASKSVDRTNQANIELQKQQNEFNERMWEKNNEYNSLAQQKQRALQAGFNPAILTGQNSVSATPVTQTSLPRMMSKADVYMAGGQQALNVLDLMGNTYIKKFQADNLKADAEKKQVETDTELLEQKYIPQLRSGQIATQNMQIKLGESQTNLTDQQIKESAQKVLQMQKDMELTDQKIAESVQTIRNMEVEERINKIIEQFKAEEMQARISQLAASANLSNTEARDILATQVARIANLGSNTQLNYKLGIKADSETNVYKKTGIRMSYENSMLKVDADIKTEHPTLNDIDRYLQTVRNATGIVGDVLGGAARGVVTAVGLNSLKGAKPIKGFGK